MQSNPISKKWIKWVILVLVIVVALVVVAYYTDYLWYDSVDYQTVFTTTLLSKIATGVGIFILVFLIIGANAWITFRRLKSAPDQGKWVLDEESGEANLTKASNVISSLLSMKYTPLLVVIVCVILAFMISMGMSNQWLAFQQFFHQVEFGVADPLFDHDISFYVFTLPILKVLYDLIMLAIVVCVIFSAVLYLATGTLKFSRDTWKDESFPKLHLSILIAILLLLMAFGYQLSIYGLLYTQHDLVYGATYMDMHARLFGYRILMVISVIVAVLIVANVFIHHFVWIIYGLGLWIIASIVLTGIYPGIIQKFVVQPNEFNCELPYLENAIEYTQRAYQLDDVEEKEFNIDYNLTAQDIEDNQLSIENIRLWDWQPLLETYKSLQELRLYYIFNDVDVDRYTIDGVYRQIMISAREMEDMQKNPDLSAEAKTWINYRLMFTHGYGVAVSPVTEVGEEGFPQFMIKDIPPQFSTGLTVSRPEIYFGESTDSYVIVNTKQQEFDYPMGEQNVYTTYEGNGGVRISSFFRRLLLAIELKDYRMVFSSDITNDSQVLMNRNIFDRVFKLAPYLQLDGDAYIVIGDDGGLYWFLDAYTISTNYPYSQPYNSAGLNYIRNSIKVVCNAYTGETIFYIVDENDPLAMSYAKIFPQLYKSIDEMPSDLRKHIRYPEGLFEIQANIYRTFHMSDPWVFYNKEDSWVIANEVVESTERQYDPYYLVTRLPGEEKEEYIIIMPYTPNGRLNLNAWMCGRMDGDNYGKLMVYQLPKQETVYGPMQIESRIDQNTEISQQLTLWDQSGSSIYRGNMLIIPIESSLLYVEPLYLQSSNSAMPELKRVIVSYNNTIVMEMNLDMALSKIFGEVNTQHDLETFESYEGSGAEGIVEGVVNGTTAELIQSAQNYYNWADQAVKQGDWASYGQYLDQLGNILNQLAATTNSSTALEGSDLIIEIEEEIEEIE